LETDSHNLPIGLKNGAVGSSIEITKRSPHFASGSKGWIKCAVRGQTRQQEIGIGSFRVRITDGDNFATGLQKNFVGALATVAEIDLRNSVGTEASIKKSVGSIIELLPIIFDSVAAD
jgi:hypothetical protein